MTWRDGNVIARAGGWPGCDIYDVELADGTAGRAVAYPDLVGRAEAGDRVLLGASAWERGLGTGGFLTVIAFPDRLPPDRPDSPGHVIKARYMPHQTMVLGIDEQESDHHATLAESDSIGGMPVVCADLHSALPAIVAGIRMRRPDASVAYIMSDGGALPAPFSRTAAVLTEAGWIAGTITEGQAWGGQAEAVNTYSALLAAALVWKADIAIVSQGPGNLGTGTRWGFSGTSTGEALNAAGILGGRPIAALRASHGDPRERHIGISHHSVTAVGRVATVPTDVPVPCGLETMGDDQFAVQVSRGLAELRSRDHLTLHDVPVDGVEDALQSVPVTLSTMGRSLHDDPLPFITAAVAGIYAAEQI